LARQISIDWASGLAAPKIERAVSSGTRTPSQLRNASVFSRPTARSQDHAPRLDARTAAIAQVISQQPFGRVRLVHGLGDEIVAACRPFASMRADSLRCCE
jgi:hypothetical protein